MTHQPPIDGLDLPEPTPTEIDDRTVWWNTAYTAVVEHAALGRTFTIYDVARTAGLEAPHHQNMWGLLAQQLRRDGVITPVDYTTGGRKSVAGSAVRVWIAAERVAA